MQNCLLANPNNVRTEPQSEIGRNKKRAEMIFIQRSASLVGGLRCNVSRLLRMCWSRNEFRAGSLKRNTGKSGYLRSFSVECGLSRRLLLTLVSSVANKTTYQQQNKQNNQTQKISRKSLGHLCAPNSSCVWTRRCNSVIMKLFFPHWPQQGQHGYIKIQQQDETKNF